MTVNDRNFVIWVKRLLIFGKIDKYQAEWTLGKYYHYNECCVKNFVNLNMLGVYNIGEWMDEHVGVDRDAEPGLIRCVLCREF